MADDGVKPESPRSKRSAIMDLAAREFASNGYRASKWGDVAEELGIGSTALYHYFASKEHCLFEIMSDTLRESRDHFVAVQEQHDNPRDVITAAVRHVFDGGELRIARNRLLMAEMNLLALPHAGSEREREAFSAARTYAHDIVRDWTRYLETCTREGSIPKQDPYLLARAILGVSSYVFIWYVPDSDVSLDQLRDTTVAHALTIAFGPEGAGSAAAVPEAAAAKT
jgi:TetR/AcrR family transcriptional regulator, cholesterol catabolism regulator